MARVIPSTQRALQAMRLAGGAGAALGPTAAAEVGGLLMQAYTLYALAAETMRPTKAILMLTQGGRPDLAVCFAASALGYAYDSPLLLLRCRRLRRYSHLHFEGWLAKGPLWRPPGRCHPSWGVCDGPGATGILQS